MKEKESSHALDPFLERAAVGLFDAIGLPLLSMVAGGSPPVSAEPWLMSVIGFASEQVHGALCVTASRAVATALCPAGLRQAPSDDLLLDAMDEFANMLLGQMKTLLGRRGVTVLLSTPTASIAQKLKISAPPTRGALWYAFRTPNGDVHARLSAAVEEGLDLDGECTPESEPLSEGQMWIL